MNIPFKNIVPRLQKYIVLAVILLASIQVEATHIVGGDITYRYIDEDIFEISLTFRRDCFTALPDATFDNPARIAIYTAEGNLATWLGEFGFLKIFYNRSDTLNTTLTSDCGFIGDQVCVQEARYIRRIRLPYRPTGYTLTYQRCCRNETLSNIVDPLNTGSTYSVDISGDALAMQNSSPVFNQWGDIYICANEQLSFDHSATDPDGDSLVYKLCIPNTGATLEVPKPDTATAPPYEPVVWQVPYSTEDQMGGTPMEIDPETGLLTAIPRTVGQFLIGLCVEEYRDGQLLSTVRRDFEYNVRICSEAPVISFEVDDPVCNNLTATFNNTSTGVDSYKWYFDYPSEDPDFISTDENPTFVFPEPGVYTVLLEGTRDIDGCSATFEKEITVTGSDISVEFSALATLCDGDNYRVLLTDLSSDHGLPENMVVSQDWTIETNMGTYTGQGSPIEIDFSGESGSITLTVNFENTCSETLIREFDIDDLIPDADFTASVTTCNEDGSYTVTLSDNSPFQEDIIAFDWEVEVGNEILNLSGPTVDFSFTDEEFSIISYTIEYNSGCTSTIDSTLNLKDLIPSVEIIPSISSCNNDGSANVSLIVVGNVDNEIVSSEWTVTIDGISQEYSGEEIVLENLSPNAEVLANVSVIFDNGCPATGELSFNVSELLPEAIIDTDIASCNPDGTTDVTLIDASEKQGNIVERLWTITINGISETYTTETVTLSGLDNDVIIEATLMVTYNNNCSASISESFLVADLLPQADFNAEVAACNEDGTVDVTLTNISDDLDKMISENWSVTIGDEVFLYEESPVILEGLSIDATSIVSLDMAYNNGCDATITKEINIQDILPMASFEASLESCNEDGSFTIALNDTSPSSDVIDWTVSINGNETMYSGNSISVDIMVDDEVLVTQSVSFTNGCFSEKDSLLNLSDILPSVLIEPSTSSCNEDGSVDVLLVAVPTPASGITGINWMITIDGAITEFTGMEVVIPSLQVEDVIEASVFVSFDNNCTAEATQVFNVSELLPEANIDTDIASCNPDGTTDVTLIDASEDQENIVERLWTITINGNTETYTTETVNLSGLDNDVIIEATLMVTYNNNCSASISESFLVADLLPQADFNAEIAACNEDGTVDVTLTNISDDLDKMISENWSVTIGDEVFLYEESPVILEGLSIDATIIVSLDMAYNNGCDATITKEINIQDILPMASFEASLESCNEDGSFTIALNDTSPASDVIDWTVSINGNETMYSGNSISLDVMADDEVLVTQSVSFTNGCFSEKDSLLNLSDILPSVLIEPSTSSCNEDGSVDILLVAVPTPASGITGINWMITIDGATTEFTGMEVVIPSLQVEDVIEASVFVTFDNNCTAEATETINVSDILPQASYDADLISCNEDGSINVSLTENSGYEIAEINWEITNGDNTFNGMENSIEITINPDFPTIVEIDVLYTNNCSSIYSDTLDLDELLPEPTFSIDIDECPTLDSVTITLTENTEVDNSKIAYLWSVSTAGETFTSIDNNISFTTHRDSIVLVELDVTLDNQCVLTLIEGSFIPGPFPEIQFTSDTIRGCIGETVTLVTNPNDEWTYTWNPVEGLIFDDNDSNMSNPNVIVEEEQTYMVTVSDGLCSSEGSVTVAVDSSSMISIIGDTIACTDTVTLIAAGGIGDGTFQWSSTESFDEIISEEDTLTIGLSENSQTIYLRLINSSCPAMPQSITIIKRKIDIIYPDPFDICRGDTTGLTISNLDPEQELTFEWEEDDHIISLSNNGIPTIMVGEEEMDSFYLYFTAMNQFGCAMEDSVLIAIVDNPMIDFVPMLEECGAYTVCFEITMDFNGFPVWDFGDPQSGRDNISFEEAPCHTYPGPGDYDVVLMTLSTYCPAEPIMKTITLTEDFTVDPIESQSACVGDTLTFNASATVEGLDYVWCTTDGDTLGIGEELVYITDSNSVEVLLKGFDYFDCSDTTRFNIEVFLFDLEFDIPDVLCNGEETQINVTNTTGGNLQYLWGPEDVIISGGDTDSPIVSVEDDTELTLSLFHTDFGCMLDTSIMVMASSVNATLTADPGTDINEGEEVTITVESDDDIVEYEWSDPGIDGDQGTVSPPDTTIYTVTVTDANGCTTTASIQINVRQAMCNEEDVFLPNAFTPNGDGNNDILYVRSNFIEQMELVIYNRWGEEVFRSIDQNVGWDGTFNGEPLPPDAYGYRLEVLCINDVTYIVQGNVSLLR